MAGIWDRIKNRNEADDPISALTLGAVVYLVVRGIVTPTQARDAINGQLRIPLQPAELTDFQQLLTNFSTGTVAAKMDMMWRLQAMCIAAELGLLNNEAKFRSELNLS